MIIFRWSDVNLKDLFEIISYPGFRQMAMRYAKFGFKEMLRSWFIPLQVNELARYIPELIDADVMRGPSGVRAQAMEVDGTDIDMFLFAISVVLYVFNDLRFYYLQDHLSKILYLIASKLKGL